MDVHNHTAHNSNGRQVELLVRGMTCSHCAMGVTKHLEAKGLSDVLVNLASGVVKYRNSSAVSINDVIKGIEGLGYEAAPYHSDDQHTFSSRPGIFSSATKKFLFTLPFTSMLLLHMVLDLHLLHNPMFQLLLATPVVIIGIVHFGRSAFGSLKSFSPNMDVLIVLGFLAAYVYSLSGLILSLGQNFLFFETAAAIITFAILGNVIEHRSLKNTTSAIEELHKLKETKAKVVEQSSKGERLVERDIDTIKLNETIQVNSGDKIPLDGAIITGGGSIDQSLLTGESVPVNKTVGEKVVGGTVLVDGSLRFKVQAIGHETVLSHIIELVENAESKKPDIQKLGDRVSAVFVPAVLFVAAVTFGTWYFVLSSGFQVAMLNAIAVLVVACPCAMGLATPTAVIVGIGRSAKMGVLFRSGKVLEQLAKTKAIVFDKTGTVTTGNFDVAALELLGVDEFTAKTAILGLEQHSSHPIAKSLVREFKDLTPKQFVNVKEVKGVGIEAKDSEGVIFKLGSKQLLPPGTVDNAADLFLFRNGALVAKLTLVDQLRPGSHELFDFLNSNNISTALLSGDRKEKSDAVARKLGILHVHAEKLPHEKLEVISELQKQHALAFVGDGVNDAPALSLAQIGVSLSSGTDIAVQSAQVVLLGGQIGRLKEAIQISRLSYRTIKENLFWAFFYNVLTIPIVAMGYLNPMLGALSMAFSDVIVVGNSLRLKHRKLA